MHDYTMRFFAARLLLFEAAMITAASCAWILGGLGIFQRFSDCLFGVGGIAIGLGTLVGMAAWDTVGDHEERQLFGSTLSYDQSLERMGLDSQSKRSQSTFLVLSGFVAVGLSYFIGTYIEGS